MGGEITTQELLDAYKQQAKKEANWQWEPRSVTGTCPACGYCPHCGQSLWPRGQRFYPWVAPIPYWAGDYPYWGTNTTGGTNQTQ